MKAMLCYGTRPEQIKLESVARALEKRGVEVEWWYSGQGSGLMQQARTWTGSLSEEIGTMLIAPPTLEAMDVVVIQGDTATAFAAALAAFLSEVPIAHVEAGLRTYRSEPFPEEAFRGMIARMASYHFCPDERSRENVEEELGCCLEPLRNGAKAFVVGNPGIDALRKRAGFSFNVLATLHRRENWGVPIRLALEQLRDFARNHEEAWIDVIRHPNWSEHLDYDDIPFEETGFAMHEPISYEQMARWLAEADVIVTDSGGVQEEAAFLGKPCLVYRKETERVELERVGAIRVVGTKPGPNGLRDSLEEEWEKRTAYGTGDAGEKIAEILVKEMKE